MRQLPEDRINSELACGSDANRFVTEIEALISRARGVISFAPRERKNLGKPSPRKSSTTPDFGKHRATLSASVSDG